MSNNIVRARVSIVGTRTLLQHHFGPESIPLEKGERTGVAGNDPEEWKKSCMLTQDGQLYLPGTYVFGNLRNGAVHTKKGRGSLQNPLVSTLQVEEDVILLNRSLPEPITQHGVLTPTDLETLTFVYVSSVKNKNTKSGNIRYRLATRAGWKCQFTISWDKTVVSREQMKAILRDSGTLGGLGDGIRIGCGRFDVLTFEELSGAEETTTEGNLGSDSENGVDQGRQKVHSV